MLKNALLSLTTILFICLASELYLRLLGFRGELEWTIGDTVRIDNNLLNYRLRPGSLKSSGNIRYILNSAGFRDLERTYQKSNNTYRILVIGDSVTFGYKVRFNDIYPRQLESLLKQYNENVEVLSIAMPGLNTLQESHLLLTEGSKYQPDMVILGYVINDAAAGYRYTTAKTRCRIAIIHLPISCSFKHLMKQSAFLYFIKDRLDQLIWKLNIGDDDDNSGYMKKDYYNKLYMQQSIWDSHVVAGFKKVATFARESKIPIILVIFPIMFDYENYNWGWIHEKVSREGRMYKFHIVDLFDDYKRYPVKETRIERGDFVHPNAFGHRIAATATVKYLTQGGKSTALPNVWINNSFNGVR